MSKLKWGLASLVVVVGGVAGANFYADHQLKQYYQTPSVNKNMLKVKYDHVQMGFWSGSADWTLTAMLDPCLPNKTLTLKGQDQIHRSWAGYKIESHLKLEPEAQKVWQTFYQQPLKINTKINWMGKMNSHIEIPELNYQEGAMRFNVAASELQLQAKNSQKQFKLIDLSLTMPKLEFVERQQQFSMQDFTLHTNQGLNGTQLEDGYMKMNIQKIHAAQAHGALQQMSLQGLAVNTETKLDKNRVSVSNQIAFKQLQTPKGNFQDLQMNFALTDINQENLQRLFTHYDQMMQTCQADQQYYASVEKDVLAILNQGFKFKSEGNQVKSGTAIAKVNLQGQMLPAHHLSFKGFTEMLPNLMEYRVNIEADKHIFKVFKPQATAAELDEMVYQLVQTMQAQRKGDFFHISMQYKNGQKTFMKEISKK